MDTYRQANLALWNEWAQEHVHTDLYDLAGFKAGATSLRHIELAEIGPVRDQSLLHLQCHFGMDSLSLARMGANVTGVDFSPEAIGIAQALNHELQLGARFVCSDLYDLPNHLNESFDRVFTSYGAICWLSDLQRWAQMIFNFLKEGGCFYMVEFHPLLYCFNSEAQLEYPYFAGSKPWRDTDASYANRDGAERVNYTWSHHLGEVVTSLLGAGLQLEFLHEFPYSTYGCFDYLEEKEPQRFELKEIYQDRMPQRGWPMTFSIKAHKPQST